MLDRYTRQSILDRSILLCQSGTQYIGNSILERVCWISKLSSIYWVIILGRVYYWVKILGRVYSWISILDRAYWISELPSTGILGSVY